MWLHDCSRRQRADMLHSQVCCFAPEHCKRFSQFTLTGFIYLSVIQINCLCHSQSIYPAFKAATCQCFPAIRSTQVSIRSVNLRIADVNSGKDLVEMLSWEAVETTAVGQQLVELLYGRLGVWYGDFQWSLRGAVMFLHASVLLQKQTGV